MFQDDLAGPLIIDKAEIGDSSFVSFSFLDPFSSLQAINKITCKNRNN